MKHQRIQLITLAILALFCAFVQSKSLNFVESKENHSFFIQKAQKYTWQEAYDHCSGRHMELLTIEDKDKAKEVKGLLDQVFKGKPIPRLYIGANDLDEFRKFNWITSTGSEPFTYTNWEENEPNNYMALDERCVHIGFHGSERWNDINCNRKYGFICQEEKKFAQLVEEVGKV